MGLWHTTFIQVADLGFGTGYRTTVHVREILKTHPLSGMLGQTQILPLCLCCVLASGRKCLA